MRLDVDHIRQQIANLLLTCPELAEDDVLRADMIEAETDAVEFIRNLERQRQNSALLAASTKIAREHLASRQARFERREEAMRLFMFKVLEAANLKKLELPEATLSVRNGQPKVIITCEELLPVAMWVYSKTPNKAMIKDTIKGGTPVPGAEISNGEPYLSIGTK